MIQISTLNHAKNVYGQLIFICSSVCSFMFTRISYMRVLRNENLSDVNSCLKMNDLLHEDVLLRNQQLAKQYIISEFHFIAFQNDFGILYRHEP